MKRAIISILTIFLLIPNLFAFSTTSSQLPFVESGVLIPIESNTIGNNIYAKMDALFILAGKGVPSTSKPWTVAQARSELLIINPSELNKETLKLYNQLYTYLFTEDKNTLTLTATLSPEAYFHTNRQYNREEYWQYDYEKRNHIAAIVIDNSTHGIYGHLELSLGKSMIAADDTTTAITIKQYVESLGKTWGGIGTLIAQEEGDNYKVITSQKNYSERLSFNMPSISNADINVPRRAYLNWANSFMTIGIYKAQKSWGYNKGGNFIFDTHNDYYSWLGLKTYSKNFNFEYALVFPETYRGGTNYYSEDGEEYRRVFATHQIEFRLFDRANIALSENIMYRFTNYFDITQLNPATIYHNNVNNNQFNAIAHVEFEISLLPSLLLYGSWVCDQGSFPGFEDKSTEDQAMGFSLGLEYNTLIMNGIAKFSIEGIYTNPALYRPTGSSDFIINYNAINANDYYRYPFFSYIGYKYGGDTINLRADATYMRDNWSIYSSLELRLDGEFTLYDKYNSPMLLTAPSGNYDTVLTFNIGGEYKTQLWSNLPLKLFADITLINSKKQGFDAQFAIGGSISYSILTN